VGWTQGNLIFKRDGEEGFKEAEREREREREINGGKDHQL